jgi:hypothetical protein
MPEIVVTAEQAKLISEAGVPVQVRDPGGRVLGVISRTPDGDAAAEVEEMKRRARKTQRSYSTEAVFSYLRSLEAK